MEKLKALAEKEKANASKGDPSPGSGGGAVPPASSPSNAVAAGSGSNVDCLEEWKNDIRLKGFLFPVSKRKYAEARAYLEVMAMKRPDDTVWFDNLLKMIDDAEKLEKALTLSGSKYAGTKIEEGTVKSILEGKITYIDESTGDSVDAEWSELDPKSVEAISVKVFPGYSRGKAKALADFLMGAPVRASAAAKDDREIAAIRDAFCEYRLDRIRIQRILDPKRAKDDAIAFLKQLSVLPDIQGKYKMVLKKLFSSGE
jgi:hypothetical protein